MKCKKCQYYDEVTKECGYHGCPITADMAALCDLFQAQRQERREEMKDALTRIPGRIENLIESHAKDLEEAWANTGEGSLDLSFSAKIGIENGKNVCKVSIAFTKEKVKDSVIFEWSDFQLNLLKVAK